MARRSKMTMAVERQGDDVIVSNCANFDLRQTLDCGQAFRWSCSDEIWTGIAFGKVLRLRQSGDKVVFFNTALGDFQKIWLSYFDFQTDYAEFERCFSEDFALNRAVKFCPGIRILRQNLHETVFSFIVSQNNNIPRIKKIISEMCRLYGERLDGENFAFPSAERIAAQTPEKLAQNLRCGYRASYLVETARAICDGKVDFPQIQKMPICEAEKALRVLHGVGTKVAQCILLYGMHRFDALPVDVWVRRILKKIYPSALPPCTKGAEGLAQQYLFHYARCHPDEF